MHHPSLRSLTIGFTLTHAHTGNCRCIKPKATPPVAQPTVGRIVHYTDELDRIWPAIVTEVPDLLSEQPNSGPEGYVKAAFLTIFTRFGPQVLPRPVPYGMAGDPCRWFWPPRA